MADRADRGDPGDQGDWGDRGTADCMEHGTLRRSSAAGARYDSNMMSSVLSTWETPRGGHSRIWKVERPGGVSN